jgi:LPS O-antigen subunit length determinant protein (WzzB/FepE family)
MEQNQRAEYNSFSLIGFIWKWRYPLLIICAVAAILSFTFSTKIFIRPKFKSTAIIYAPRTNSVAKILLNEQNYNEKLDMKAYAVEEETEQMMQILNSRGIQNALIKKFNLSTHYDIDTTQQYWKTKLYKAITNNVKIKRTEYGAIAIIVTDWDPKIAADIANEITYQLDTVKNKIEYERAASAFALLQKQDKEISAEIKRIDDSLSIIMEHGVFDFESQSERVTQQYAIAVAQGNVAATQRLQAELNKLSTWGPTSEALSGMLFNFREYQVLCKSKMMDAKMDMEAQMPVKFVIEKATPSDKKDYPKKSVIVIISTLSAFIVAVLALLTMENIKKNNRVTVQNINCEDKEGSKI